MAFNLLPEQEIAISNMHSGCLLYGGVGSGKTFTSLIFYKRNYSNRKLYVITTAKKRDTHDWEDSAKVVNVNIEIVDSWNSIKKLGDVKDAFFIFDEQRVVGYGSWAKYFIKITKSNDWILLSATPGDTWSDYIPVFIANGYFKNKTEFINEHVEFDRFAKFPKIKKYHETARLQSLRRRILVPLKSNKKTGRTRIERVTDYDKELYKVLLTRINPYSGLPIETPSEFTQLARKIVATSQSRIEEFTDILIKHKRIIVFYNYDYELDIILNVVANSGRRYAQWNGHVHELLPVGNEWIYILQYTAGSEAWECITTDSIVFYSRNYSYKITEQAEGRIDRMNTPYLELFYYYLSSKAPVDKAVKSSVIRKKRFNESLWARKEVIF